MRKSLLIGILLEILFLMKPIATLVPLRFIFLRNLDLVDQAKGLLKKLPRKSFNVESIRSYRRSEI